MAIVPLEKDDDKRLILSWSSDGRTLSPARLRLALRGAAGRFRGGPGRLGSLVSMRRSGVVVVAVAVAAAVTAAAAAAVATAFSGGGSGCGGGDAGPSRAAFLALSLSRI